MTAKNPLVQATPYEVEQAVKKLGADLRTARLRRNLTVDAIAAKIGTGRRAVADAEKGKVTTQIAVYAGLLWALGLIDRLGEVADPTLDQEGQRLALTRDRVHARRPKGLDNDF
jgi:transcriptional regulator with XRE-family HTH domain